jgi:hypothetical protein
LESKEAGNQYVTMEYYTYFDIVESGYIAGRTLLLPLLMIVVAVIFYIFRKEGLKLAIKIFPYWIPLQKFIWLKPYFYIFYISFAILWSVTFFLTTSNEYKQARDSLLSEQAKVVEGVIHEYKAGTNEQGAALDTFCVKDVCFEISDYRFTSGFHQQQINGGPLKQGLPVRISYVGNTIVRLEISI